MSSEIQSLEVSYFLQMTEDEQKVVGAVSALLGQDQPIEMQDLQGHFGNRILWVRHHLTGDTAESAAKGILGRISPEEKRTILGELTSVLDEHNALYIRLNKQVLVSRGETVLASSDPVRVKVKPRSFKVKGDPEGFYRRLFGEGARR